MTFKDLSFRAWCLLVVGASLACGTLLIMFSVDRLLAARDRGHMAALFDERLDTCTDILARRQSSLESLGLSEAFRGSIQDAARQDIASRFYGGQDGDAYPVVLDAQGRILLHPSLPAGDASFQAAAGQRAATSNGFSFQGPGGERWGISRRFEPWGWTLVYSTTVRSMTAALLKARLAVFLVMAIVCGVVVLGISFFLSLAMRPIRDLTVAASRMAEGDLSQGIDTSLRGELGSLARSFQGMRESIGAEFEERARALEARNVDLEEARRAALAGAEAKSAFLANMSHEIRTPLNGVLGTAELLTGTGLDPEQRDYVNAIVVCGESLLAILNDILDLSKLDAGKLRMEHIPFDPLHLVYDVVDLFRAKVTGGSLELLVSSDPPAPPRLLGDPGRLRQVLGNLVSNAIKFTPSGHVLVALRCVEEDGEVTLEMAVEDTGMGIAPETQAALFQPFAQADVSTSRKFGGTGLGLVLCKRIVDAMGGGIRLESQEGVGSRFTFSLTMPPARDDVPHMVSPALLQGLRILVVDDNARNIEIFRGQLQGLGGIAVTARSGMEALAVLQAEGPFELAVLDRHMPEMDGETLGRLLRLQPGGADLGLVACTSSGRQGEAELYRAAGFDGYLVKPVRMEVLGKVLALVLDRRRRGVQGPLVTRHVVAEVQSAAPVPAAPAQGLRVLLVEDNNVNQMIARKMLEDLGAAVQVRSDGFEAVKAFQENAYDLILMDCQMPGLDGFDATGQIRVLEAAHGASRRMPIVALTALAMSGDREKCLAAGMDDHLTKPLTRRSLEGAIQRWGRGGGPAPAVPSAPALPVEAVSVDWERFHEMEELFQDTPGAFLESVLRPFFEQAEELLATLAIAEAQGDAVVRRNAAHTLKGSSRNLGFVALGDLSGDMERRPLEEPSLLPALRAEVVQVAEQVLKG
jgi:signal transduction histidine kinase/DNA-binding response OmpR family regulator